MPRVTVEASGFVRKMFGAADRISLSVPSGTSIQALLARVAQEHRDFRNAAYRGGRLLDTIQIVVNDQFLDLAGGTERIVADGDRVLLLPPFEGGAR